MRKDALIQKVLEALPKGFGFYHLGEIEIQSDPAPSFLDWADQAQQVASSDQSAIVFHLEGDLQGSLMILIDRFTSSEDTEIYKELGNVLLAKLIQAFETQNYYEVSMSAPRSLVGRKLSEHLTKNQPQIVGRIQHQFHGQTVQLQSWLSISSQGAGNA